MRIAYFSPLPPATSGIADYSAELLPHLDERADVTLFVDSTVPVDPLLADSFTIEDVGSFEARRHEFDVALYQMGNDAAFHGHIYQMLRRASGIVVAHETVFYHLLRQITVERNDFETFRLMAQDLYGPADADCALRDASEWYRHRYTFPALMPVLINARGVIVHSRYAREQVRRRRPDLPVAVVPHHLSLPARFCDDVDRDAIRQELGLQKRFVIGSFGFMTADKRPAVLLRAFAQFRQHHPEAVCCIVGQQTPGLDLVQLTEDMGLPDHAVHVTGRVPMEELLQYMVATDVAVNLRYPTQGETSGTLIRLLGLGVPTLVSDVGSFSEFPEDVCIKVPVDGVEHELLVAVLRGLAASEALRQAVSTRAQEYARAHHSLEGSARGYVAFIERVLNGEAEPVGRPARSPFAEVVADIGATLAGWGISEDDDVLLQPVAQTMAELGLSQ